MKRKEVEDVMGGKDAWANVDKTDGERALVLPSPTCPFPAPPRQNKNKTACE